MTAAPTWRYLVLRRLTQGGVLLLALGTVRWGWTVAGVPVLRGNLSAGELIGRIPLADPFALLQILLTGFWPGMEVLLGATLVLAVYGVLGGRVFCSWICPINPVTDLADWLGRKMKVAPRMPVTRSLRFWILGLSLLLSPVLGLAAFEWISPVGIAHRELIFGVGWGWLAVVGIFCFDLLVLKQGWCGHLCPMGAFYGLVGRTAQVRVGYDEESCTLCGECEMACPEPQVLDFAEAGGTGFIASGLCTNCGRCVEICPEGSLGFTWRRSSGSTEKKARSSVRSTQ